MKGRFRNWASPALTHKKCMGMKPKLTKKRSISNGSNLINVIWLPLLWLLILSLFIQGCSVYESRVPSPDDVVKTPEHYANLEQHNPASQKAGVQKQQWWQALENPELNHLITLGLSHNLDIAVAIERLAQARAAAGQAQAARLPWIGFNLDAQRSKRPSLPEDITGNTYQFSLSASYEVDLWRKFKSRADRAEFLAQASEQDVKSVYISVAAQIADLYYMALEQKQQSELADAIINSSSRTLELVMDRYRSGIVEPLDVYQARQTLESARSRKPVYEAGYKKANHALSILLGRMPDPELIRHTPELPQHITPPDTGIPADLLLNRPDVRSAWLRLRAFDAGVAAAVADLFPSVRIGAGIGQSQTLLFGGDPLVGGLWNLFLSVAQPVFEGGRRVSEIQRQQAMFREALAAYHKVVLNACKEVEDALASFRASEREMYHLKHLVEATQSDVRLSTDRYLYGLTEYLPVLTAQTLDLEARTRLIIAQGRYVSDWISLVRALGGTWPEKILNQRLNR